MKRIGLFFLSAILIAAYAPGQSFNDQHKKSLSLFEGGDYEQALPLALSIVDSAKFVLGENNNNYMRLLYVIGRCYEKVSEIRKADSLLTLITELNRKSKGDTSEEYAESLNELGTFYKRNGQYQKAEAILIESLRLCKKIFGEDSPNCAACMTNIGGVYEAINDNVSAKSYLTEAIEILEKNPGKSHPVYASAITKLGKLCENAGDYDSAEHCYLEAIRIRKTTIGEKHPDYASSLSDLAYLCQLQGLYVKSKSLYEEAISLIKKNAGTNHSAYTIAINDMAILCETTGEYATAEQLYKEALTINKKFLGEKHPDYASNLNNMGNLYASLGLYEKAEPYYVRAVSIYKDTYGETSVDYGVALANLAHLFSDQKDYKKAEGNYIAALLIFEKTIGRQHFYYAATLANLGDVYASNGEFEKALAADTASSSIFHKTLGPEHPMYATSLNNLAFLYETMGKCKSAEPLYREALRIYKNSISESDVNYTTAINNLASVYQCTGDYQKAEPLLIQNARNIMDKIINYFSFLSNKEKQGFINNKVKISRTSNSYLYLGKDHNPALISMLCNVQLFIKGLILADEKNLIASIHRSTDTTLQQLFSEWIKNKTLLAKQYGKPPSNRRVDLKDIEDETESLEKSLSRLSIPFRNQQIALRITTDDVRKHLEADEVAIEFTHFKLYNKRWTDSTIYAAYVITPFDSVPSFVSLFEEKQLQKILDSAGKNAKSRINSLYRGVGTVAGPSRDFSKELYRLIWSPLKPYLKNVKKISFSASGELSSIAMHAIATDKGQLLTDQYALKQYISTREIVLAAENKSPPRPENIVLFGNPKFSMDSAEIAASAHKRLYDSTDSSPLYSDLQRGDSQVVWPELPGTATETKIIHDLFTAGKMRARYYSKEEATEDRLKSLNGNSPRVLHIATHGFFFSVPKRSSENSNTYVFADDPLLRSGLILAGGNYAWSGRLPVSGAEDGVVTAYEISQLNFSNTELVVLSACETGLGDINSTEGVMGLQRAFKMAGVKKMILSLWQVPDKETIELMSAFYEYWIKGKTIEDSFRQAQSDMRKKYSAYYWAAFVLVE